MLEQALPVDVVGVGLLLLVEGVLRVVVDAPPLGVTTLPIPPKLQALGPSLGPNLA